MTSATVTPRPAGSKESATFELQRLVGALRDISTGDDEQRSLQQIVGLARQLTNAFGIAYLERNEDGQLEIAPQAVSPADFAQLSSHRTQLFRVAMVACSERNAQVAKLEAASPLVVFAVPVFRKHGQPEAIVGVVNAANDTSPTVASTMLITQLIAAYVAHWRGRLSSAAQEDHSSRRIEFAERLTAIAAGKSFREEANQLADAIRELLNCRSVALGVRRKDSCRLLAMSGEQRFDANSSVARQVESVMDEALLDDLKMTGTASSRSARNELVHIWNAAAIDAFPISSGDLEGACLVVCDEPLQSEDVELLTSLLPNIGSRLDLLQKAYQSSWRRLTTRLLAKDSVLRKPTMAAIALALFLAMLFPTPHRIACDCSVQPVKRRFVAVPYEGRLDSALIAPGDSVAKGQTLAVMDGSEIRYQLAGLNADYDRAQRERQEFLASQDISAAQIAALQMERLKHEITILRNRQNNLEIKSPIDGVVISGDPQKIEGARVTKGEKLVEVGPIQEMLVELQIPEEDVLYVRPGQKVRFRLHSDPLQTNKGILKQLHPRSEQVDSQNIFVGEVLIQNEKGSLRPGMSGKAHIIGSRKTLGWNLFHKAWNKAIFRLGW